MAGHDDDAIPREEEQLLARVLASLAGHAPAPVRPGASGAGAAKERARGYADEMVALRDEIGEARLEDVPALVAQMERLQGVSLTRAEMQTILVDPASPYFGHLRLREGVPGRGAIERDVLIGRATFVDPKSRINIVDWRHAPVSQLFYRYTEGSDYEETFADREVEGEILARRTLTIENGQLLRVACPQGIWTRHPGRGWQRTDLPTHELAGGQGTATRPTAAPARGVLGAAPAGRQALDRHLPEIAALIDPRQFEVITARHSGVVVIQGGAGSGKTTVGLHRLAYLAYTHRERFPARKMVVVTQGAALAAYIGHVLPSLGITGVRVMTFRELAQRELRTEIPWLRAELVEEAAPAVTRVKSHPALLHEVERLCAGFRGKRGSRAVVELWADLLTDRPRLVSLLSGAAEMPIPERDVVEAHRIMVDRVAAVVARDPREQSGDDTSRKGKDRARRAKAAKARAVPPEMHWTAMGLEHKAGQRTVDADLPEGVRRVEGGGGPGGRGDDDQDDDQNIRGETGIDGLRTEDDQPLLDTDDLAILLRASQLLRGVKDPFAHLFVDEAQDLSPMKLSVLIGHTTAAATKGGNAAKPSITLAGDTSQRLFLDNGFGDWRAVLAHLSLAHVAVEPLRIAYRSTREIMELARHVMGPLADPDPPEAPRHGAPVESFRFPAVGAAVAFLAEALRDLAAREPRATVALIARHPEQADRYYEGLRRAEVPALRRVRAQDFAFRPGVEVTDVRQVKGLEFDYVVMLDANASSYGREDEARHLLHIGVTRAAHQLWMIVTGSPSPLLPS